MNDNHKLKLFCTSGKEYFIREFGSYYFEPDNSWTSHPKLDEEGNSFKEAANTVLSVKEHNRYLVDENMFLNVYNAKYFRDSCLKDEMTAYELATDFVYNNCTYAHVSVYPMWINCIARQFILIKTDFLELELKFNPLKTLVQEQQVKISVDANLISGLQTTQQELLDRTESITLQNNLIQDSADQKDLLLQNAYDLINQKQATNEEQNSKISNLERSVEEMAASINSLKDEKLKYSIENISLESKFKTEKIEYKRRIKESGETITYFRSKVEKKEQELVKIKFELSQISPEFKNQHFDSQQESYATSDDEGEILPHNFKIM